MAADAMLGELVSRSSSLIILAITKTWYFKSKLREMQALVNRMRPKIEEIEKLNREMDRQKEETRRIIDMLVQADRLVLRCLKIKWQIWMKLYYDSKLDDMNTSLKDYVQSDVILGIATDVKHIRINTTKLELEKGSTSSGVPLQKGVVIGFDDRVQDLKDKLLKDCRDDDCSIVVVSAPGGFGKTTLVKKFCNDPEIQERFGDENIHYVTVSQKYNLKGVVKKLLPELPTDANDEDAIHQWELFVGKSKSEQLLVLDDVWSDKVINDFKFKLPRYKILVTSRITFKRFKTYELQVLNNQDATRLFCCSAFSESGNKDSNITDHLVNEMVKCCKNHPLLLEVIGGMLNGAHWARWEVLLKELSKEKKPFSYMNKTILESLKMSLFIFEEERELKQYFMHLGLFPEDEKIAATALMDMWVHLYNHDEDGSDTMNFIDRISSRNLATLLPKRKHPCAIVNHCEEEFVTQHDTMRELAIITSSEDPIKDRETLIINAFGKKTPRMPQTVNARVLSISTDKEFLLTWNKIQAPKVEVFVLNYMSKIHPLPQFIHNMKSLKVLIITNYGYYFSEIQNFPEPDCLSGLTRIRLDHVSISSISTTILKLESLQKLSLIMCKIGNSFNEHIPNKLTSLLEIVIDSCEDLVTFPAVLCNSVRLKKISITNCHELTSLSDELGNLSTLEVLRVASCSKFTTLPEAVTNLKKLRIIDISQCLELRVLPEHIGELRRSLKTINAIGCMSLHELPKSLKDFDKMEVFCDEETSYRWRVFKNLKVEVVVEDPVDTFFKIYPRGR